ncbi:MAG: peptidase M28 family protein, partial [Thermoanaerobaculia bacterium]|nr:peptidase M28 family protein [Thermoanaerobaculia bacterium]
MTRRLLLPALFLVLAATTPGPTLAEDPADPLPASTRAAVAALAGKGSTPTRATEWVRRLTDEVGPRLAGSPGDRAAVAWSLALFRELGFANVRAEEVPVTVWERGVEAARVVSPFPQGLVVTALGGSSGTVREGVTAPVCEMRTLA